MPLTSNRPPQLLSSQLARDMEDAIFSQDLAKVTELLATIPGPTQDELNEGLSWAIEVDGDVRAMDLFFNQGAQITKSAFDSACMRRDTVAWQSFIDRGWDINSLEFGDIALGSVLRELKHVEWFLDKGADPNLKGRWDASPLRRAAMHAPEASIPVLSFLLSHGADLDPEALFAAIQSREPGGLEVTKYLIDQGISVNVVLPKKAWKAPPYISSRTPLYHAVHYGNTEAVKLLLDLGADKRLSPNGKGGTPAEFARLRGYMDIHALLSEESEV